MCALRFDMRYLRYGQMSFNLAATNDSSQPEVLDLNVLYPDSIQHDLEK